MASKEHPHSNLKSNSQNLHGNRHVNGKLSLFYLITHDLRSEEKKKYNYKYCNLAQVR